MKNLHLTHLDILFDHLCSAKFLGLGKPDPSGWPTASLSSPKKILGKGLTINDQSGII